MECIRYDHHALFHMRTCQLQVARSPPDQPRVRLMAKLEFAVLAIATWTR
jgi:hypothetical protein